MPVAEEYVPDMHMLHTDELEAPLKMQDSEKHFRHFLFRQRKILTHKSINFAEYMK